MAEDLASDIREALAQAAAQAPLPGPRVGAWMATVPVYAAQAREQDTRPVAEAARGLIPGPRPWRRPGARRTTLAAALVAIFSLSLVVAGVNTAQRLTRGRATPIATASVARGSRAPAIAAGPIYDGCPPTESRVVNLQSGYTFCRPSSWQVRDYGFAAGSLADYESVTGLLGTATPATPDRHTPEVPAADILVTVSFETVAQAAAADHLMGGKAITVAGVSAMEYAFADPLAGERVVLIQRSDRLYRIEQVRHTRAARLAFHEVLRTFMMQGLPYSADEQLRIAQSKTG